MWPIYSTCGQSLKSALFAAFFMKILCIAKSTTEPFAIYFADKNFFREFLKIICIYSIDQLTRIFLFTKIKSTSGDPLYAFNYQCFHHIEASQLFCFAIQLTGFYTMRTLVVKRLNGQFCTFHCKNFSNLFISNIKDRCSYKKP